MAIKVFRNTKESGERLIQRFTNKMKASRLLLEAKERLFHKRKPSKRRIRSAAMMRDFYRKKREKMKYYN